MTVEAESGALWRHAGIECVVVPAMPGYDVQLRNSQRVTSCARTAAWPMPVLTKPCQLDTFLAAARLFLRQTAADA